MVVGRFVFFVVFCLGFVFGTVPEPEKNALVDFYNSLSGPYWRDNKNWLDGDPCDDNWVGISCARDGSTVYELDRGRQNMSGTLPMSLSNLTHLSDLVLSHNEKVTGTFPTFYSNLEYLTQIAFQNMGLSGSIPPGLGMLTRLNNVQIGENHFSGTIPNDMFGNAPYFGIQLEANSLTGTFPESFCKTPGGKLTLFVLDHNKFTGTLPDCFNSYSELYEIRLNHNLFSGTIPNTFSHSAFLSNLVLSHNLFTGSLPPLLATDFLQNVRVEGNLLTGPIPESYKNNWAQLFNHTNFFVSDNQLSGTIPDW
eukprot:CAMPEP_0201488090 /NCGR_PEP_ID=MMETSP0151_2-20130828/16832_1 /ASSEMBLY_ACC=CAM_ASM_000257 /TAXON_ID=200890 /ORGANISM="Paramoeba atlantica, Strain 621/1 / CCAP 1560/9" /LENGTH=308 /DNA_ID=CAMNT_0047873309 /DNA_START=62 /DNA_END=985 /DNA_ORIENTATION=+